MQQANLQSYLQGYWCGVAGILVSDSIDKMIDMDETNYRFKNGGFTQVNTTHRLKYDIYIKKYTTVGPHNLLYYNPNPHPSLSRLSLDPNNWIQK